MMKMMNKVMAIMAIVSITMAMPAVAGNKKNNDRRNDKVVVVVKEKKAPSHFDAARGHFDRKPVAPRPDVRSTSGRSYPKGLEKVCSFKVSRHSAHRNVVAKAESIHGVMDAKFNPHTGMMTVRYDAHRTTPRIIRNVVA